MAVGIPWLLVYLLKLGTMVMVLTPAGAGEVYAVDTEQERLLEVVSSGLADRGQS